MAASMDDGGGIRWPQSPVQEQSAKFAKTPIAAHHSASVDDEMMQVLVSGGASRNIAEEIGGVEYHVTVVEEGQNAVFAETSSLPSGTGLALLLDTILGHPQPQPLLPEGTSLESGHLTQEQGILGETIIGIRRCIPAGWTRCFPINPLAPNDVRAVPIPPCLQIRSAALMSRDGEGTVIIEMADQVHVADTLNEEHAIGFAITPSADGEVEYYLVAGVDSISLLADCSQRVLAKGSCSIRGNSITLSISSPLMQSNIGGFAFTAFVPPGGIVSFGPRFPFGAMVDFAFLQDGPQDVDIQAKVEPGPGPGERRDDFFYMRSYNEVELANKPQGKELDNLVQTGPTSRGVCRSSNDFGTYVIEKWLVEDPVHGWYFAKCARKNLKNGTMGKRRWFMRCGYSPASNPEWAVSIGNEKWERYHARNVEVGGDEIMVYNFDFETGQVEAVHFYLTENLSDGTAVYVIAGKKSGDCWASPEEVWHEQDD